MRAATLVLGAAFLALACSPAAPAPPSAAPTPATIYPVTTFAPEPSPAVATAVSSAARLPTPRPSLGLPVLNARCSTWPSTVQVPFTELLLPPSLCLLRTDAASVDHLVCTVVGCVPVTKGCASQGYCTQIVPGTEPHYVLVFIRAPAEPPPPIAETYVLTRSLCRMHQDRTVQDATLPGAPPPSGGWLATAEAREFGLAFAAFESAYPDAAAQWRPHRSDLENYADVCAAWYYPAARDQKVNDYPPLATWAKKWLPD